MAHPSKTAHKQRKGTLTFHIHLTLAPGRDDDLIAELRATPLGGVAARVREMMRSGISSGRFLAEIADECESIEVDVGGVGVDL